MTAKVDLAVDEVGTQVLPMTLFLLYERWYKRQKGGGQGNTPAETGPSSFSGRSAATVGNDAWALIARRVRRLDDAACSAGRGGGRGGFVLRLHKPRRGEPRAGCTAEPADAE